MISLTYVSIASRPMANEELLGLLNDCVRNNEPLDITGMLLYKDRKFMQVLEGPEAAVRKIYAKVEQDDRHHSVVMLIDEPTEERLFPQWTMAFRDLNAIVREEELGYQGIMNEEPLGEVFPLDPARANRLMRLFRHAA